MTQEFFTLMWIIILSIIVIIAIFFLCLFLPMHAKQD